MHIILTDALIAVILSVLVHFGGFNPSLCFPSAVWVQIMMTTTVPNLRHKVGTIVTPGDRLGLIARGTLLPGAGTYIRQGQICASVLGTVSTTPVVNEGELMEEGEKCISSKWIVSVTRSGQSCQQQRPQVGMIVLGRVTRVARPSHASIDIVAIIPDGNNNDDDKSDNDDIGQGNDQIIRPLVIPLLEPYPGTLRQGEIKPKSSLEVRIEECVRPGDVILARIHAEGEREYILSTAEAELGVVRAVCEGSGVQMEAISWKEMRCPITLAREPRKVAKPRLS